MQNVEEQALATYTGTIPLWLSYVNDTFTAAAQRYAFQKHLKRQNADIQFTKGIEENNKIPFLDCLVTRESNRLGTTIYRKRTNRLLKTSHRTTQPVIRLQLYGL